jgi:transposase
LRGGGATLGDDDLAAVVGRGDESKRGLRWKRPRHTLKGRQDLDAVERSRLRLKLLKQQAAAGDLRALLFEDESEALTHPYLAHVWAERGADLRVEAPGQSKKRAMLGVRDAVSVELTVITSATKRSTDFIRLLEEVDRKYAPDATPSDPPVVVVLDNGPIHTSKASRRALAERPWLRVEWLPKYAPELNEIERDWCHLKRHHLANQVVRDVEDLDRRIHAAVATINAQRRSKMLPEFRDAA